PRRAALPALAALGGMIMPAALYLSLNVGGPGAHGWGVPMATDIAFALGVLALLGPRAPASLKVFLLSVAVADDIGAIAVIAIFYSGGIAPLFLGAALALLGLILFLRSARVWWTPVYVVLGVGVWVAVLESGVHATIAGVALGLATPVRALDPSERRRIPLFERSTDTDDEAELNATDVRETTLRLRASASVAERLEDALHPWTSYVIVPLFALANAGVALGTEALGESARSPVTAGIVLGLVLGKIIGISGFTWLAVRLGLGSLPRGVSWLQVVGVAAVAGVGFTVALFIAALAFDTPELQDQAKIGILLGSLVAAMLGAAVLAWPGRIRGGRSTPDS
ncbi:MAG: Na+/H+ antiporter NhaA, partial [Actinomycetota bacterium]